MDINTLSVFTGSGFHDTAVAIALEALGYRVRAVGYVERDSAAAATLMARMANTTLDRAPVWCDCLSLLDARHMRGWVDLLIASPPCQPYSSAGKRLGTSDHRSYGDGDGPLVHTVRIIAECEPAVVWFENVPEWFTDGHFREFGEQLCELGYDIAPPFFGSSGSLGNVHERERVFCIGVHMEYTQRLRARQGEQGEQGEKSWQYDGDRLANASDPMGDTGCAGAGVADGAVGEVAGGRGMLGPSASDSSLADSQCGGRRTRIAHDDARKPNAQGSGGALAHSDGAGLRAGGESKRWPGVAHPRGNGLAVPACRGLGAVWQPPRVCGQPDGRGEPLADAQGERQQGREPTRGHGSDGRPGELGVFVPPPHPPGRPIFDDEMAEHAGRAATTLASLRSRIVGSAAALRQWAGLAAGGLDPTLMPAVVAGLPMVAHENATPAISNADLLRIGGNAVDVLVAANALGTLWRKHVCPAIRSTVTGE